MPDARPIENDDAIRICTALAGPRGAQVELEQAVAQALLNGSSVRAVAELGLSPNTVQKYGQANGWPTEETAAASTSPAGTAKAANSVNGRKRDGSISLVSTDGA
jgi:hypothetical protein